MTLAPGTILNNDYRIEKLLGEGGFGAVYRAWDLRFELHCAIKENKQTSPEGERQFLREAQLLRKLRHPNLPQVTDYFILPSPDGSGGTAYLVMDYIEGEDLEQKLVRSGKPLDVNQALAWIGQICDALTYLHSQNPPVIHRDIKPGNIRITPDGRAFLVDFGLAKYYAPQSTTTVGAKAVTPGFAPTEQYGSAPTDPRSDVYSLGATLFYLLTRIPPVEAPNRMNGANLPPLRSLNPDVPPAVVHAVMKALELFPRDRWASVADFHNALHRSGSAQVPVTAKVLPGQKPAPTRSKIIFAAIMGALFITVLGLTSWAIANLIPSSTPDTQTEAASIPNASISPGFAQTAERTPDFTATIFAELAGRTETAAYRTAESTAGAAIGTIEIPHVTELPLTRFSRGAPMALIPAGEFMMGNDDGEMYNEVDEGPAHPVYLDAFYIDVYEVTNAQFSEFLNAKGNQDEGGSPRLDVADEHVRIELVKGVWKPRPGYENHPAVELTWYGAQAFCEWRGARLPTEAEWEKAARGGLEGALYPWGNQPPTCRIGATNGAQFGPCEGDTVPVGSFAANGFGLFDMAGNVWEFVQDWHRDVYYAESPFSNPVNMIPDSSKVRVARGGSWVEQNTESYLRTARRDSAKPEESYGHFGFRCALTP